MVKYRSKLVRGNGKMVPHAQKKMAEAMADQWSD